MDVENHVCYDCKKLKLPMGKSMYDGKWRCTKCNKKYLQWRDGMIRDGNTV